MMKMIEVINDDECETKCNNPSFARIILFNYYVCLNVLVCN